MSRPKPILCTRCQRPILTGLDGDRCALTVRLEATALTPEGEVWALQHGRPTYELHPTYGIRPRDRWNTPGNPPGPSRAVVPAHDCTQPTPDQYRQPLTPKPSPTPPGAGIPF